MDYSYDLLFIGMLLCNILVVVQTFLSLGTAYRFTKKGGGNGVALWGWMIVFGLAALVPGLGIYLWLRYRHT